MVTHIISLHLEIKYLSSTEIREFILGYRWLFPVYTLIQCIASRCHAQLITPEQCIGLPWCSGRHYLLIVINGDAVKWWTVQDEQYEHCMITINSSSATTTEITRLLDREHHHTLLNQWYIPANTTRRNNNVLLLSQRRKRWTNNKTSLFRRDRHTTWLWAPVLTLCRLAHKALKYFRINHIDQRFLKFGISIKSQLALSASFQYLSYGSTAIINIVILTVRGTDVRFRRLKSIPAL